MSRAKTTEKICGTDSLKEMNSSTMAIGVLLDLAQVGSTPRDAFACTVTISYRFLDYVCCDFFALQAVLGQQVSSVHSTDRAERDAGIEKEVCLCFRDLWVHRETLIVTKR
jgi:hypothetical protein